MIIVDVQIPAVPARFDFNVDENRPIRNIIGEMRQVVARKLHEEEKEIPLELCSCSQERFLPGDKTLAECGIRDGERLILV